MKRWGLPVLMLVGVTALTAKALMIAPPPAGMRVATAQAVVVGKVVKLADKTVPAEMFKGDERQMMIATVKVEKALLGKAGREIKVGYFVRPMPVPGAPILSSRGLYVNLVVDQEALLMLQPHPTRKDVLVAADYFGVINKKDNPNFEKELAEVKRSARLLADPMAGLKSKDADERFRTTALLVTRYRTRQTAGAGAAETEKVSVEESKLILANLAEADWATGRVPPLGYQMAPRSLFFQLGLRPADGWTPPKDPKQIPEAAKKWLKDNAGKYQVVRYKRPALEVGTDPEP
jgi:hypothetical protein